MVLAAGEHLLARVLDPVDAALGLDWDPATSGSASAELGREVDPDALIEAMIAELGERHTLIESDVDDRTMELARELRKRHRPSASLRPQGGG